MRTNRIPPRRTRVRILKIPDDLVWAQLRQFLTDLLELVERDGGSICRQATAVKLTHKDRETLAPATLLQALVNRREPSLEESGTAHFEGSPVDLQSYCHSSPYLWMWMFSTPIRPFDFFT